MSDSGAPSLGWLLLEGQRALLEGMAIAPARGLLRRAARGDGQPVLVLPGFMADDGSTAILRRFLKEQGFSAHPWLQGRNRGPANGVREALADRLLELERRHGRRVAIVGWSLGGVYAREIAKRTPDRVRQVITLGSPFRDVARPNNVSRAYDRASPRRRTEARRAPNRTSMADAIRRSPPPSVPTTSIFSKSDGVVHWSTCIEEDAPHTENIEVQSSHCGLGHHPLVLYAVADRLSQPEGAWQPFESRGWRRLAFGTRATGHGRPGRERGTDVGF